MREQPKLDKTHEDWVRKIQSKQTAPQPQAPTAPTGVPGIKEGLYLVCGALLKPTVSGQSRMNVQLQKANGQKFQAYTYGPDTRLAPGMVITNVKVTSRNSGGITFYVLDAYDVLTYTAEQAA